MNEKNLSTVNSQMQGKQFPIVDVLIPAYNEEQSIGKVIAEIPDFVRHIVVVNNRSTDNTRAAAEMPGLSSWTNPKWVMAKLALQAWLGYRSRKHNLTSLFFWMGTIAIFRRRWLI
jgi:cellulose synthase/poly-beta-1,6-N-acetylglucosamine synthase-like glycosyltransferase